MLSFGKRLGLVSEMDEVGNVLIKSRLHRYGIKTYHYSSISLGHGASKNNETNFDFENEGIKMYINDGWVGLMVQPWELTMESEWHPSWPF